MRLGSGLRVITLLAVSTSVYAVAAPGSFVGSSSTFTIDHNTDVPGQTLKPGDYTIRVLDQLSDRMIVRVDSSTGKEHAIFLGVPSPNIAGASAGAVSWSTSPKGSNVLRGFSFSAGSVEFVYPKTEAVALAKLNTAKVLAVDPESEGMPSALKNLSKDDMQIVNLWTLSLTTTGADKKPGILAQHYQGDAANSVVASANVPAAPAAPVAQQPPAARQPTQVATLEQPQGSTSNLSEVPVARARRPVLAKLPKTASYMPLVWMLGFIAFLSASCLRLGRKASNRA